MKLKALFLTTFFLTTIAGFSQTQSKFKPQLDKVLLMFSKKDIKEIEPLLHKNYIIAGVPAGINQQLLPQLIQQLPGFDAYTIKSEKKEKNGTRINLFFTKKNANQYNSNFLIDGNGKILELNILENASISTQTTKQ